ncbi:calponin homology domain-containing protein DDB_G0272472-like isoform X2 [Ananas comosus]|uniref:Calponin homology domain-containing protein DDB_G0272472-like isoform X2 n=1 Tax=Ananas comosus TaxID=4615 RepID=A0A6P5GHU4_ANACO|nr:calponin homology domain-containing protein DDB_G0272472-like isoform X2 [Ananas comosus]
MMENADEVGDDQGSGWFEVKKKHRSNSKLLIQKASGGSFYKAPTLFPHHSSNDDTGNWHGRQQFSPSKLGHGFSGQQNVSVTSCSQSPEIDQSDELLIDQEITSQNMRTEDLKHGTGVPDEVLREESSNVVPEISKEVKDLNSLDKAESPKSAVNDKQDKESLKLLVSVLDGPSNPQVFEGNAKLSSEYAEQLLSRCSDLDGDSVEALKETYKVSTSVDNLGNFQENQEVSKNTENECGDEMAAENCPSSPIQGVLRIKLPETCDKFDNEPSSTSELQVHSATLSQMNIDAESSVTASVTDAINEQLWQQGVAEVGEGELESKERFRQRLWCFLFENLNRAVDELYLLCELECDREQMDEAILVLEEATSDFRELKCRVEHFDNTKKSSLHSPKDGMAMTVKADHRRPHALSWEVRRMTTSPQRAEILSSSLEAFKKIQLERARNNVAIGVEELEASKSTKLVPESSSIMNDTSSNGTDPRMSAGRKSRTLDSDQKRPNREKQNSETSRTGLRTFVAGKSKREPLEPITEMDKHLPKKDKEMAGNRLDKQPMTIYSVKSQTSSFDKEKEKEKQYTAPWKSLDAWKEKRNWEDILKSPIRSSRVSHSPGMGRKGIERAKILRDKLMSPEKKKKSALDVRREAEEKHARAMRIRNQLENERVQRLQRTSEKLNRVNEWQAVRSLKLREVMNARHQRSESRHEAYLAQVVKRAGDESSKVNEVRFITSLNEENKKLILRQKLLDSQMRRAEKLQVIRIKQKEDTAREEAVLERRRLLEAEKLQRLAEIQRKKEEAQVRREEERKASSAAREAKAMEQLRRKEIRAKAQQEEAELLAQRLAERLRESEQRRKSYLEQIREKASMDFRDQSSPLQRRSLNKESQSRSISTNSGEEYQNTSNSHAGDSAAGTVIAARQHSLKRRIKKIRQRLMALKHDFIEPPITVENTGIAYRAAVGAARVKIIRWLQDLQRLRQARKEGAASIGLIVGDIIKFLEGKDLELHASRQAGLLDFIASSLVASHTSKPEACQVTVYLLRLLRVLLSLPANQSYFLAQNLLPPLIPMLSSSLENYIKVAASSNPSSTTPLLSKTSTDNLESVAEVLDGFLWTVTIIVGHGRLNDKQIQMQDGLIELIVAYQVIHHLRDLFALYDRPQVEGTPFPSSILYGLNLLAVLTSRPGTLSSIDWETCKSKSPTANAVQKYENSDSQDRIERSIVEKKSNEILGNGKLLPIEKSLLDKSEGETLLEENKKGSLEISSILDDSDYALKVQERAVSGASLNVIEEHLGTTLPQKDEKNSINISLERKKESDNYTLGDNVGRRNVDKLKQPVAFILSAIAETSLVSLPSLLTAVLLQANNKLSSEQASYILPSNFEEVATGVLKILNNLAILDITLLQSMLARSDLQMEFFHLISFLLTHCTNKWKAANDQVGLLLLESLLLLGYFALFHPGNQAVLRWGKSPTILHKSCRQGALTFQSESSPPDNSMTNYPNDGNQTAVEARKLPGEMGMRSSRRGARHLGKALSGSNGRATKPKIQRDGRATKTCDDWALKHNLPMFETSSSFMLHRRFPISFLDKAEEFFSTDI